MPPKIISGFSFHRCFPKCFFFGALTCFLLNLLACRNHPSDLTAYNRMRLVWVALSNYESKHGVLPLPNANSWRFSDSTSYKKVSWRALMLEEMVGISAPRSTNDQELVEKEIAWQGKDSFIVNGQLIYSNLEKIRNRKIQELPGFVIMAFTVTSYEGDWNSDELESVDNIVNRNSSLEISSPCTVLFANGNVGVVASRDRLLLLELFDPITSAHFSREMFEQMGGRILEPSKTDFRN